FERKAIEKALFGSAPVVEESPAFGQIPRQARRGRHAPRVDDVAVKGDEIDLSVSPDERGKESEPRKGPPWVQRPPANTSAFGRVRLHGGRLVRGHRMALQT